MPNWRQIASEAKDILTICLAKAIDQALIAEVGTDWFQKFVEEDKGYPENQQITKYKKKSPKDLDMQALLKILRYRPAEADKVYAYYGVFADMDKSAADTKKRQLTNLLNRLIGDFRNQIEAHTRSEDAEKRLAGEAIDSLYGYEQAYHDMCVLIRLFKKVTDKNGVSYADQMTALPKEEEKVQKEQQEKPEPKEEQELESELLLENKQKRKPRWVIIGAVIAAVIAAAAIGVGAWALTKDSGNVYQSQRTPVVKQGEVTLQPIHVRYEKGKLIAECYVINGTDKAITDIDVYSLRMTAGGREIAAANFGVLEGVTLSPGESIKWEFCFTKKTVFDNDAYLPDVQAIFACRYS